MLDTKIPKIPEDQIQEFLNIAKRSDKRRCAKILHSPGDVFNAAFNFMMNDSYMQPHLHPGVEKIEKIHLIRGKLAILFFGDKGQVEKCVVLEKEGEDMIEIPAFHWHTYVMLTDSVVTYETMMGVYEPQTWKSYPNWAPQEGTNSSAGYLDLLRIDVERCLCR